MRSLRLATLIALTTALAVLAGCGGGAGNPTVTGEPISFEQLSQAAKDSAGATTGRFEFSFETTMPGTTTPFSFTGEGAFDAPSERASLSLDLSSFAELFGGLFTAFAGPKAADAPDFGDPSLWRVDAVVDGLVVYMRFGVATDQLPAGKAWVRVDARKAGKAQGFDFEQLEQFTNNDPRKVVELLRAASGEIETVGTEELRGVATTHYRARVDLADYKRLVPAAEREELRSMLDQMVEEAGLQEMPVDVWLDELGLVRKLTATFSATQPGTTESMDASVSFELYDYGKDVEIELPPSAQVVDASALD